jgi:hypothetical protein
VKRALALLFGLAALALPAAASANTWTSSADMPYYEWGGAAAVLPAGDRILLAGGFGFDTNPNYAGLRSGFVGPNHAGTISWTRGLGLPSARGGLALANGSDGRVYVMGGQTLSKVINATVYSSTGGAPWLQRASLPGRRTDLAAVGTPDGRIFAIGGAVYASGAYSPTVTVQIYNIASNTWTSGPPLPAPRSELAAALGADGRIYAFGGYSAGPRREAFSLDPNNLAAGWTTLPPMPAPHELPSAVTGPDGTMYVIGGWDGSRDLTRVEAYNPTAGVWSCTVPLATARSWSPSIGTTWGMATFGGAKGTTLLGSHESMSWSNLPNDSAPPVVMTPPTGHLPTGQIGLQNVPFLVSWTDSDATTDILDQQVESSTNGGTSWSPVTADWPTQKSLLFGQYPGFKSLRFRVTPKDCAGNVGAQGTGGGFSTHAVPESGARYAGGWGFGTAATARGGHTRYSSSPKATATFTFTGREMVVFAPKSPVRGTARISVDGKFVANVSEYAKTTQPRMVIFRRAFATNGVHRVAIRPIGTPGHPRVDIDGFLFIGAAAPTGSRAAPRAAGPRLHAATVPSHRRSVPSRR